MISYNSTLAFVLEKYFKYCRMHNRLNEVSANTFKEYVDSFRSNVFSNASNCSLFISNPEIYEDLYRFQHDKASLFCNYEEVMQLISLSLEPGMNLEKYLRFYNQCISEETTNLRYQHYSDMLKGKDENTVTEAQIELLNEYIKYAEKKYGGASVASYLESYINGRSNSITRDNNFRRRFIEQLTPTDIRKITNNKLVEYVKKHLANQPQQFSDVQNYNVYLNACITTYKKYGANQLYNAIMNSMHGDYSYFTNSGGGYRDIMLSRNFTNEIYGYCMLIVKNYGNGLHLSDNLYIDCTNAIVNYVKQQNSELKPKTV